MKKIFLSLVVALMTAGVVNAQDLQSVVDMYNAAAEREVKREQMDTQMKIAKTNKNKYD